MRARRAWVDIGFLIFLAVVRVGIHVLTNHQYGFHRDELALLDDSRHLAWGYVAYPPVTPFIGRVALELFGPTLSGVRFFSALAQGTVMVLAGLIARELGGSAWAQVVAALGVAIAPISLLQGSLLQYVSFDYLWWVLVAYFVVKLTRTHDRRWWLAVGLAIGVGLLTKYTMIYLVAGLGVGVMVTPLRRDLTSGWFWGSIALALLIISPHVIWQAQHDFVSLAFLADIHARDVAIGRTAGFLVEQAYVTTNPVTIPLWGLGLVHGLRRSARPEERLLACMYTIALCLFLVSQGRSYYLAPAYPGLIAIGSSAWERWASGRWVPRLRTAGSLVLAVLVLSGLGIATVMLPVAPVNSALWNLSASLQDNFAEEIGWPELVENVHAIYRSLPPDVRARTAILAGNYGEAGAIDMFGPEVGLPQAISGMNSYWFRGYGETPPETVIVVGFSHERADQLFTTCLLAGHVANSFGVVNEETERHPDIYVCRGARRPWPDLWQELRVFG